MLKSTNVSHTLFCASSYRFRYITILDFLPLKIRSRSHDAIFAVTPFENNCQNLKCLPHIFALSLTFRIYKNENKNYLQKVGQGHWVQFSQFHHSILNAKEWPMRTILTDKHTNTNTHTQRNGQAPGYRRILQICQKIVLLCLLQSALSANKKAMAAILATTLFLLCHFVFVSGLDPLL